MFGLTFRSSPVALLARRRHTVLPSTYSPSLTQPLSIMFATVILSQVLLAASALAVPTSHERYARRIERRALGVHLSKPSLRHDLLPSSEGETKGPTDNANVQYSGNWAGEL